ncbi:outer membrane beta-barrel protein [Taklimakanibacter lacteus]|uniref:outer membrane beta-barrel protein n=1 Tax=Taklimakanibacter lacteus TaxID=2268456 RepID=UPI000E66E5AF
MTNRLKLSVSAAALALLVAGGASSVQAADVVADPGCTLSGSVMAGYMYNWQDFSAENDEGEDADGDVEWSTPFGEGAGLVTCGGFNVQADIAYYAHSADIDDISGKDVDLDQTNTHIGGALFYRDPYSWAGGVGASWISQDIFGKDIDIFRVGLFGEFYFDDMFTLGASAHYYNADWVEGKDEDGFELAAWGRFYATPDFSLLLRGDLLFAEYDISNAPNDVDLDLSGFAITGEAEYLVWDQGLSVFGGARYADRELDIDDGGDDVELEVEDFQVFAGIKFYFGQGTTLVERQRTGTVDNTSVFNEKLPSFLPSAAVGAIDAEGGGIP